MAANKEAKRATAILIPTKLRKLMGNRKTSSGDNNKALTTDISPMLSVEVITKSLVLRSKGVRDKSNSKKIPSMANKLKKANMTVVFTALKGDTEKGLLKDVGLFVDEVVG